MYQIYNNIFCLSISDIGAELEELCINGNNILWHKNELWNSQSPILFPVVGSLKDDYYIYDEKRYHLASHGFLREQRFKLCEKSENRIRLVFKYDECTLKNYPFKFEFYVTYTLEDNRLKIIFEVKNIDDKEIYFSCGFHPGFDYEGLHKLLGGKFNIYFYPKQVNSIRFNPSYIKEIVKEDLKAVITEEELSRLILKYKTLCYEGLNRVELVNQAKRLIFKNNMPYMAFWQKQPDHPKFLCIESWNGLPDRITTNHQLSRKMAILKLEAGASFQTQTEIRYTEGVNDENN